MKLSVVILNYNTSDLTKSCLVSLERVKSEVSFEIVVIDNGSDEELQIPPRAKLKVIDSKVNLGFAGGNNLARKHVSGEYVLFLNSDTEVYENTLKATVKYLDNNPDVGAITCKTILPSGELDKDARRSFPTPWVSLTHFSGLDRIFPKSRVFSQYWYGYRDPDKVQEVDCLQGAYFMTRREVLEKVNWFSEDYFLDGEDIDLSWKVKNLGYKIIYYPKVAILHIKKASKKKRSLRSTMAGVNSMEIFYKKHLWEKYPLVLNLVVVMGIYVIKVIRFTKVFVKMKGRVV